MTTQIIRKIGLSERPWAYTGRYRNFLGTFVQEPASGVFFAEQTPQEEVELISSAFLRLPEALQALCREYELTVSTCGRWTVNGNSSTFYADFQRSHKKEISPHVEMSSFSLAGEMVLPHLAHEAAHLWWRNLPQEARDAYTRYLAESCSPETDEVTAYVQDFFRDWQRALSIPDTEHYAQAHRKVYLKHWAEESFCDTVAVLVASEYPSYKVDSTVDLAVRLRQIRDLTGLDLA